MTPCQNVANYRIVPLDMYEYILALETISWWCTYYVYTPCKAVHWVCIDWNGMQWLRR